MRGRLDGSSEEHPCWQRYLINPITKQKSKKDVFFFFFNILIVLTMMQLRSISTWISPTSYAAPSWFPLSGYHFNLLLLLFFFNFLAFPRMILPMRLMTKLLFWFYFQRFWQSLFTNYRKVLFALIACGSFEMGVWVWIWKIWLNEFVW